MSKIVDVESVVHVINDVYKQSHPYSCPEANGLHRDIVNAVKNMKPISKPIITKEIFVESMKKFVRTKEESDKMISNLYDTFGFPDKLMRNTNNYEDTLLNLLQATMNDQLDWLDYYVYERGCEWFEYHINNETVKVDSFEKLYELITTGDIKCDWRT